MKDTRETILNTAIDLFKKEGYDQISINEICRQCDITKGTFYYHFKSKHDIVFYYYDQMFHDVSRILPDIITIKSAKEKLWKVYEYSIDITINLSPSLLKSLLIEDAQHNDLRYFSPYRSQNAGFFHKNYSHMTLNLIRQAQADHEISRNLDPDGAFKAYTAAIVGVALDWSCSGGNYDEKERLKEIFDAIFHR